MRIWLAFRAFFRALFDSEAAKAIDSALSGNLPESAAPPPAGAAPKVTASKPAKPQRSEAVTLLATLQREARFVDLVMERLDSYSDAQVGAAARDVLRDCGKVLERLFQLQPVSQQEEESPFEVAEGYDSGSIRLVGNVQGEPPFTGKLVHHGWMATRIELPKWSGSTRSEAVVAPAEVEVK
jgi:hypothetical protein